MPHKTFDVPLAVPDDDPITFDLAGRKMTCLREPPLGTYLMLGGSVIYKRDMPTILRGCLVEGDEAVFDDALRDKRYALDLGHVEDAFWYVVECYGERMGGPILVRLDPKQADGHADGHADESTGEPPPETAAVSTEAG